jgi:uncharacterized surface protein with fasciclin (FAS1) repeats
MALGFTSCNDDDDAPVVTPSTTITDIAVATPNLSILVKALTKADLANTLKGAGPFTVFAPTNQAFIDAGYTEAVVDALPASGVPALKELLLNHVVSGAVQSTGLTNNTYIKTLGKGAASSTNTLSMYVEKNSEGVFLNGYAEVTTANIIASNGVIHIVDAVIGLPTIATHATANPNFSTLTDLLSAQGLVPTLSGTSGSPFTVFAPLNSAFDSSTLSLYGGLTSAQQTAVLTYHVVGGANVLSNAIPTTPITTLETGTFTIAGTTITDEQNRQTNIVLTDVQCSNGVIHAVNKVLLPAIP